MRITFIHKAGMGAFVAPLAKQLEADHAVVTVESGLKSDISYALGKPGVVVASWCDDLAVAMSRMERHAECKLIVWCRSFEVLDTNWPAEVLWSNVDKVIFVAEHVKEIALQLFAGMKDVPSTIIPTGVDLDAFEFDAERDTGYNLCYLGYLNSKKAPALLLQVMSKLCGISSDYRLNVGGVIQDRRSANYWEHMLKVLGLQDNIVMHGWVEDRQAFLAQNHFALHASHFESGGMFIREAMAMGITPVVHWHPGAGQLLPQWALWRTVDEAVEMINRGAARPHQGRAWVEQRYSLATSVRAVRRVLGV